MVAAGLHRGVIVVCIAAVCGCEYPHEPGWGYRGGGDEAGDVLAADVAVADVLDADVLVADVFVADVPVADVPVADVPVADVFVADVPPSLTQRSCTGTPQPVGCGLVVVPRSTSFVMGAPRECSGTPDADCANGASPPRSVTVDSFAIDAYEVTVARFRVFWNATGGAPTVPSSIHYRGGDLRITDPVNTDAELRTDAGRTSPDALCNWHSAREGHPMNCVSWATAQAFCAWDMPGGRLPTQAEWEFAARGNSNLVCPWGSCANAAEIGARVCWSGAGMSQPNTCPVEPRRNGDSPFGLHDMAGNVWEWNADWYAPAGGTYWSSVATPNPLCGDSGTDRTGDRVIRGGSWTVYDIVAAYLRSASRIHNTPTSRNYNLGFRCARDTP